MAFPCMLMVDDVGGGDEESDSRRNGVLMWLLTVDKRNDCEL